MTAPALLHSSDASTSLPVPSNAFSLMELKYAKSGLALFLYQSQLAIITPVRAATPPVPRNHAILHPMQPAAHNQQKNNDL